MENFDLQKVWKSHDQKIDLLLEINKELAINLTNQKLHKQMSRLYPSKWVAIFIGVPYTLFLLVITFFASMAQAYFVALGFGVISLIMIILLLCYGYQIFLIRQVKNSEDILSTQKQLSKLRISSFNCLILSIFQLPFWSICWMSFDAFKENPISYGGTNIFIFFLLSYIACFFYQKLSYKNGASKFRDFFLSGPEWEPIYKSTEILNQLEEYQK